MSVKQNTARGRLLSADYRDNFCSVIFYNLCLKQRMRQVLKQESGIEFHASEIRFVK